MSEIILVDLPAYYDTNLKNAFNIRKFKYNNFLNPYDQILEEFVHFRHNFLQKVRYAEHKGMHRIIIFTDIIFQCVNYDHYEYLSRLYKTFIKTEFEYSFDKIFVADIPTEEFKNEYNAKERFYLDNLFEAPVKSIIDLESIKDKNDHGDKFITACALADIKNYMFFKMPDNFFIENNI